MLRFMPRRPAGTVAALSLAPGRRSFAITVAALVGAAAGCQHIGQYVWVQDYKDAGAAPKAGYVISRGDSISVRVWNQDTMSGRARVRSDGMISLPFVNDVEAAGVEPGVLAQQLQVKLKQFVVNPIVTVSLEEPASLDVSVVGEVAHPGVYRMEQNAGVLRALAAAGGLTQFAGRDRIFVLRHADGPGAAVAPIRIRFTYEALAHVEGPAARFRLLPGDVVVVE